MSATGAIEFPQISGYCQLISTAATGQLAVNYMPQCFNALCSI